MSERIGYSNNRFGLNNCQRENGEETDGKEHGWFNETAALHSEDIVISTRINRLIYQKRSDYQNILIFQK